MRIVAVVWTSERERERGLPSLPFLLRWYLTQKKTLELNPRHPLIKELQQRIEKDEGAATSIDLARVLFDTAVLRSGFALADSAAFAGRIERILRLSVGVDAEAPVSTLSLTPSHSHMPPSLSLL